MDESLRDKTLSTTEKIINTMVGGGGETNLELLHVVDKCEFVFQKSVAKSFEPPHLNSAPDRGMNVEEGFEIGPMLVANVIGDLLEESTVGLIVFVHQGVKITDHKGRLGNSLQNIQYIKQSIVGAH